MKNLTVIFLCALFVCLFFVNADAQPTKIKIQKTDKAFIAEQSPELQTLLDNAVKDTISGFLPKVIKPENVAATLIDLREPNNLRTANFRGEQRIYPASVVKMFYMAALHRWLEDGKVKLTPELTRGLRDMIVDSSNEATQYILDVLTDTSSGGELSDKEFKIWSYKRNAVNRYFTDLGYTNINVNQKTFCEDAYGREQQFRNYKGENRNMLTTNATARLLAEIALRKAVTLERSNQMLDLMKRDFSGTTTDNDDQAHGFTAIALINRKMTDAKLWSKAGWTSKTRHDAAYIETPDGLKFVLVVFTENMANERDIIPTIAGKILDGLRK
ncbi:MAG: class A beta-lactamase-related serine hydrolase [Acidobacteriota bacterium]|nr:class A beta-lactamase-related serine hydrolase [Acidobacteriota bacterium]